MLDQENFEGKSRREFLKASAAAGTVLGGMGAFVATPLFAADGYAAGMTGGPTGFPGAERFQYNGTMSEGRAIAGIKALQAAGKAPKKLRVLLADASIDQIKKGYRDGAMAPLDAWTRETGLEIEFVGVPLEDVFKKVIQDVTTGDGAFDVYTGPWNSTGDLVAANGAVDCTEFVQKYKPDWSDRERGVSTAELEKLLYTRIATRSM